MKTSADAMLAHLHAALALIRNLLPALHAVQMQLSRRIPRSALATMDLYSQRKRKSARKFSNRLQNAVLSSSHTCHLLELPQ